MDAPRGGKEGRRTILFNPINSAGHMNASLAIADRLRQDHNYRCVFLLTGPYLDDQSIERHGHQLITIEDLQPYYDYELEPGEDPNEPVDEARKLAQGKTKKRFVGAFKWPQMILRREKDFRLDPLESVEHRADMLRTITMDCLSNNEQQVSELIELLRPDLIVADVHFPPACVLLNEHSRPWVHIHTANPMVCCESKLPGGIKPPAICGFKLYTKVERERMRANEPGKWAAILDEWKRAQAKVEPTLTRALEPVRQWYAGHSEHLMWRLRAGKASISSAHLNIYLYPKALDYDQEDDLLEYPARWLRCESLLRNSAGSTELSEETRWRQMLDAKLSGGANNNNNNKNKAMIYFSLGSIASANFKLMQRYVNFLSQDTTTTGERLYVVSKGVNGDKYELDERNMIGGNYLPQAYLLQRANLAIVHGGNNTITECLHYGVPMIVMPNFADQLDNAQRVEDLHLGKRLDLFKCTSGDLLQAIDQLLGDSALIERVRSIGKRMQTLDELGKVSDVIRGLVENKCLDASTSTKYGIKLG